MTVILTSLRPPRGGQQQPGEDGGVRHGVRGRAQSPHSQLTSAAARHTVHLHSAVGTTAKGAGPRSIKPVKAKYLSMVNLF